MTVFGDAKNLISGTITLTKTADQRYWSVQVQGANPMTITGTGTDLFCAWADTAPIRGLDQYRVL